MNQSFDDITDLSDKKKNDAEKKIKDPTRCSMCLIYLKCPRSKDQEQWLLETNIRCIISINPFCQQAIKATFNKDYVAMLAKM